MLITDVQYFLRCDGITQLGTRTEPCQTVAGPARRADIVISYARSQHWEIVDVPSPRHPDDMIAYCPRHDPLREKRTTSAPEPGVADDALPAWGSAGDL